MNELEEIELIRKDLLEPDKYSELLPVLQRMPTVEVAELLWDLDTEKLLLIIPLFTPEQQGMIVSDWDWDTTYAVFNAMSRRQFAVVFENMHSAERASFYRELDRNEQINLLPYLSKRVREDVIHLSSYEPETAGGIMSTDFATILENMTISEAIEKVRKDAPSKKMVYYVYVVDEDMKMKGFVTLKRLIMHSPDTKIMDVINDDYVHARVDEDQESVARKVDKYDLVAIPVLNDQDQLVGIVTHDEAIEIMRAEATEDIEKFMGLTPSDEESDYLEDKVRTHYRKRIIWLASLAALSIFSGVIVQRFEGMLAQVMILTLFMPMMTATGGNTGSQAATVVITALSLGQVTLKDWLRIFFKESRVGVLLGMSLGILTYINVVVIGWNTDTPESYGLFYVAMVVALAMTIQVFSATLIGSGLPLLVKRLGGDPAVAASPAITTFVDITGLIIYFTVATLFFTIA
jgi:magnesium transporter